ncbi:hypothetical protein LXL04_038236 [Taraxacum kok-saghyz]
MSPILSELFVSGCMINSTYWRRTHLVQSFSVVFLYCLNPIWVLVLIALYKSPISSFRGTTSSSGGSDLQGDLDQRKKRRMISNRESAKRSRMRKQKHLDDLMTQLSELRKENNQVMSSISITTQHFMSVEAENLVMRAQVAELSHRLQSLNEIIDVMRQPIDAGSGFVEEQYVGTDTEFSNEFMNNSLSYLYACQPILASADMILY